MDNSDRSRNLQLQYNNRFSSIGYYRNRLWRVLCEDYFQKYIDKDSTVLDLGCGWGEFINNIEAKKKFALDLNPESGEKLSEDVQFVHQSCTEHWPISESSLDLIFTSNFFEHLPNKSAVEDTVERAKKCLKPGGKIICLGPNIKYLPGGYWNYWDHHVPISEDSLAELLILKGFRIENKVGKFLPYTMSDGKTPPLILVRMYLMFPMVWRIFGKQFLLIACRE